MSNLYTLLVATAALVAIPGPNVALIAANSMRYGLREGLTTVLGTTLGVALQLLLVVAGLAAIVEFAAAALTWIKWAGVAYLLALGIHTWRQPPTDLQAIEARPVVFWRGCLIAAVNPKTLLFNAAFLPQFVAAGSGQRHVVLIATVFLAVVLAGDSLWALFANSARRALGRFSHLQNRLSGAFFVVAGTGLAMSRRNL